MTDFSASWAQILQHLLTTVSSDRALPSEGAEHAEQDEEETPEQPEKPRRTTHGPKRQTFDAYLSPLRLPPWANQLTVQDRRLLQHISDFYSPLISNISPKFVLWTRGIEE
jgi:hypothetical protein